MTCRYMQSAEGSLY